MVCRTVRYLVKEGCYQLGVPNTTSGVVEATLMRTPPSVIIPLISVADTVGFVIKKVPLLKDIEITRIPVVGPVLVGVQAAQVSMAVIREMESKGVALLHAEDAMGGFVEDAAVAMSGALPFSEKERIRKAANEAFFELLPTGTADAVGTGPARLVSSAAGGIIPLSASSTTGEGPAPLVNKEAAMKAFSAVPSASGDRAKGVNLSKVTQVEDLVGSVSAAIMNRAHDEVRDKQRNTTTEKEVSSLPKTRMMPLAGGLF